MGEMITKPDANPIIFAVCNALVAGALGYFLMGQKKKAMITGAVWIGLVFCTLGFGGIFAMLLALVTAYDAYLLGQKLASGESIGEVENGLEFLNMVFK